MTSDLTASRFPGFEEQLPRYKAQNMKRSHPAARGTVPWAPSNGKPGPSKGRMSPTSWHARGAEESAAGLACENWQ